VSFSVAAGGESLSAPVVFSVMIVYFDGVWGIWGQDGGFGVNISGFCDAVSGSDYAG